MISFSLMLVLAAFFGCAGGYRQAFLYLVIYASMVSIAAIVQFSMGGVSASYQSGVSGTMDTLWSTSNADQRSLWMKEFKCCYYGPEETYYECKDSDAAPQEDTDCQVILTNYLTGLFQYLTALFFSFGSISLLAAGVTLAYGFFGGGPKGNFKTWKATRVQIHSKEDFEKFVLGDIAPVSVPVVVAVTPVADSDREAFDRSECC